MSIFSLLGIFVYAAEVIISPLPADFDKPGKTFSEISIPVPVVLGVTYDEKIHSTVVAALPTPTATPTPSPTPMPTLKPTATPSQTRTLRNDQVTIALLGDSMVDTLGPGVPDLQEVLQTTYPTLDATILNYGVGGTNIDYGIERITNDYEYLGRHIPSLASKHPNIVVLESFGYNPYPFDTGAVDKHWLALAKAVETLRSSIPGVKIVIASTIAPNAKVFADGAPGLSFSADEKWKHVDTIKQYLESTTRFAIGQHLPLADAYHRSLGSDGNGFTGYINAGDHIHTSPEGRKFFAKILSETIIDNKLLE